MSRIVIKESEIRRYVRSLIREAMEDEGRKASPENERELEKMRRGEDFNFGILGQGAKQRVREYFKEKGIPMPKMPKGGVSPEIINGATGEDKTPANSPEAIAKNLEARKTAHNQTNKDRYFAKKHGEETKEMNQLVDEPLDDIDNTTYSDRDTLANDELGQDAYAQKWLALSDDEKAAMRDKIRQNRINKSSAENEKYRDVLNRTVTSGYPTPEELKQQIVDLKSKQSALGQHNDINDKKWREYDYLIKDREKILNKYYGGSEPDTNDEMADEIVNNAFNDDLSGEEEFSGGDYGIERNKQQSDDQEYEPLDDDDFDNRSKKKRDFDDLKDMGFYDDEDDW